MKNSIYNYSFIIIVLLAILVRLYGITNPLTDSHEIRQAQTAMVSRNICLNNMDIIHTKLDFIGYGKKPVIQEFPIYSGIVALLYKLIGIHDILGRLVSVLFSLLSIVTFYLLSREFLNKTSAIFALIIYVFSPLYIYFGRAFMLEELLVFFTLGTILTFLYWEKSQKTVWYLLSILCAIAASLQKPYACIILIPILFCWFYKYNYSLLKKINFWAYYILILIPNIIWLFYQVKVNAENHFINGWGISLIKTLNLNLMFTLKFNIKVIGSMFLFLLTPIGFVGSVLGIFNVKDKRTKFILFSWLGGMILYYFVLSRAILGHPYYQLLLLPLAAIFFGFFIEYIINRYDIYYKYIRKKYFVICFVPIIILYGLLYYKFFNYMYDTSSRVPYHQEISTYLLKHTDRKDIILSYQPGRATATTLSYLSHRIVWLFHFEKFSDETIESLKKNIKMGATYFVAINTKYGNGVEKLKENKNFWNYLRYNYGVIVDKENYIIVKLVKKG